MVEIEAISINETARVLDVSPRHIHRLIKCGKIPTIKLGRRRLIRPQTLARLLAEIETTDASNAR